VLISWSQVLNFLVIFLQENSVSETSLLLICVWSGLHFKSKLRIPYQTAKLPIYVGLRLVSEKTIKSNTEISSLFNFSQESQFLLNVTSRATKPFFFSVKGFVVWNSEMEFTEQRELPFIIYYRLITKFFINFIHLFIIN
jgi:hypothetical protein